ncbi:MAG TPA: Adventurous gliding motility protein K, partial [Myxococcaceae bacterium]|nr:Adventurous gliding motility protein K [Myxococcaceae bacterium]
PRAITAYRAAVEMDRNHVGAHAALADLYMRDAAAAPLAVQEHLAVLRLDPTRLESLHSLFRLWEGLRQTDKAFAAAAVLHFLRAANEVEGAYFNEARNRLGTERPEKLLPSDLDAILHPAARNPVVEVFRAMGDQLDKIHPPQLESLGVDRKQDKLKPDHAVFKAVRSLAQIFGVEEFEVYQARRGIMTLETTEPLSVCVGQDVIRKFNAREQKFLIGRAVLGLANKTAVLTKLSTGEAAELVASAVRVHQPQFALFGRRNEELVRTLRKAFSRKALKNLEAPSQTLAYAQKLDLQETLDGITWSGDRAGMLMCGDISAGLSLVLREDPNMGAKVEAPEQIAEAVRQRVDMKALISFALSDEFFRLRQKLGLSV